MAAATSSRLPRINSLDFMRRDPRKFKRPTANEWAEFFDTDIRSLLNDISDGLEFTSVSDIMQEARHGSWDISKVPGEIRDLQVVLMYEILQKACLFFTSEGEWLMVQLSSETGALEYKFADRNVLTKTFGPGRLFAGQVLNRVVEALYRRESELEGLQRMVQEARRELHELSNDLPYMKD